MRPQHPFKILRKFLKGHPDLKQAATQDGFAKLVDCSRSLVRAVEQEQTGISPKLAKKVQATTGVAISWLATKHDPEQPIPGADGKLLTHADVISRIKREISGNINHASANLLARSKNAVEGPGYGKESSASINRRLARDLAKVVEDTLYQRLACGDTRLMAEIAGLLARHVDGGE